jgi:hypothetical protein
MEKCSARAHRALIYTTGLFCIAAALTVASCADDGPGSISVAPGKFTFYHCNDFSRRLKELTARENELRGLIEKANDSAAGAVIGSIAYRSDYEAVLSEEKLLRRTAGEKNCSFTTDYHSDQIIR